MNAVSSYLPRRFFYAVLPLAMLTISTARAVERFYTPPTAFQQPDSDENKLRVELPGLSVSLAQHVIDATRREHPEAHMILKMQGDLLVHDAPLRLGSNMSLVLSPTAGVKASESCTSESLIEITHGQQVSISSSGSGAAHINGNNRPVTGIRVAGGKRIHVDNLSLTGCGVAGIDYKGYDPVALNQAAAVTRCHFSGNGNGLRITNTGGFMCLDNTFEQHSSASLSINSLNSIVAGNTFAGNETAILSASNRGVIARNEIGNTEAIVFTPASRGNLVTENLGTANNHQLIIAGAEQQIFRNRFAGRALLLPQSSDIYLTGNPGLDCETDSGANLKYFNPPTYCNPHENVRIVDGMGRHDLPVITGGRAKKGDREAIPAVSLAIVQEALDHARAEHPNAVLVLKLTGEFISRSPEGLVLPPNTCLILEGRILADLGMPLEPHWVREAEVSQIILLPKTGYSSVSGGTLDGGRQVFHPINASTGSIAVIEDINIASGARDGIYTKGRSVDPLFIYRCSVYANGGRGIWAHVTSRTHAIANNCVANNQDGIDLDAHSIDGTALFNTCSGNRRHGVFVEEGIQNNIVFANKLNGNRQAGVHVWNEEVVGNTGPNIIAANECNGGRRGISVGGRAADKTAHGNFFFNNICRDNRLNGMLDGNTPATGNYFSQNILVHNFVKDVESNKNAKAFYFDIPLPEEP